MLVLNALAHHIQSLILIGLIGVVRVQCYEDKANLMTLAHKKTDQCLARIGSRPHTNTQTLSHLRSIFTVTEK